MEALIRLKRPLDDSPSDTLILNCNKKRKFDVIKDQDDECLLTVLKFTGTQHSQDEDISKHISDFKNSVKSKLDYNFKKHKVDINKKLRLEAQENSKINRYKVINCLRLNVETDSSNNDNNLTIYDLELDHESKPDQKFVFDLYYSDTNVLDEVDDYNISIYPTAESLVFDSDDVYNIDEENDDSDDSNAENQLKNEYPDESDVESINEEDIVEAVRNMDLNNSLSSEDEFAYCTENNEEYQYEVEDELEGDYGTRYAKFKAKYKDDSESQEDDSLSLSDISGDDIHY